MTEEAQPPAVDRTAEPAPDAPAGYRPGYLQPSYELPGARSDQPAVPVSEWARPAGEAGTARPTGLSGVPGQDPPASTPTVTGYGQPPVAFHGQAQGGAPAQGPPGYPPPGGRPSAGPGYAPASGPPFGAYPPGNAPVSAYPLGAAAPGGPGPGAGRPAAVPAPPRESWRPPRRIDPVRGTPFGVAYLDVPPVTSGPAVGALVTGIGAVLVSLVVGCFGLLGATGGWGGWAAGAFALLAVLLGVAGLVLGQLGRRQTAPAATPPTVRATGRGLAIAGMVCGGVGLGLTVLAFAAAVLLQLP
ncbi:phage holin family protein [Plantactinospora sp. CA-290183]|uniref:DUF4190 domain-containing protein n=1 Tax=Plantactinospora sp. CA-290183 TaxID=3240006 RepID=UPI003D8B4786